MTGTFHALVLDPFPFPCQCRREAFDHHTCIQLPPPHKWIAGPSLQPPPWNSRSTGSTHCLRCPLRFLSSNNGLKMSQINPKSEFLEKFNLVKWHSHHTTNLQGRPDFSLPSLPYPRSLHILRLYFLNLIWICLLISIPTAIALAQSTTIPGHLQSLLKCSSYIHTCSSFSSFGNVMLSMALFLLESLSGFPTLMMKEQNPQCGLECFPASSVPHHVPTSD